MYELAQINVARLLAPLDDPLLADFVANLDPVNAAADTAAGFVWRLSADADLTESRVLDDDWIIVNMSVWRSPAALLAYVYSDRHRAVLRRRREWFARLEVPVTALWWVPAGHRPTVAEAEQRLIHLRLHGPGPVAFTLRTLFPAPDGSGGEPVDGLYERRPVECDA
jgi:uncharacterized protein DUF3291